MKYILLSAKMFSLFMMLNACVSTSKKNLTNTKSYSMDNTSLETKKLKPLETFTIDLNSRGALGLQILYKTDKDSIIEVKRLDTETNNSNSITPGDSINIKYEIKALKPGNVNLTFYETQPWNKEFKQIIQKEINIEVSE